jgi:hypothetical protein
MKPMPASVTITRARHPLEGRSLAVLGGIRRHGVLELLLELPDGSKSLIPVVWTDAEGITNDGEAGAATLGSLTDLLIVCELVADLIGRRKEVGGQAAGTPPSKEESRAACPTQFDTRSDQGLDRHRSDPDATPAAGDRCATRRSPASSDHVAGRRNRQSDCSQPNGGGR